MSWIARALGWSWIGWLLVAGLAAGCGEEAAADDPGCRAAMEQLYGAGCAIWVNSQMLSQVEATQACAANRADAGRCGCEQDFQAVLDCFNAISSGQCADCNQPMDALEGCIQACF